MDNRRAPNKHVYASVHAFISSRLDCCSGLLKSINQKAFNWLQMVQNAAARLLTRNWTYYTTPNDCTGCPLLLELILKPFLAWHYITHSNCCSWTSVQPQILRQTLLTHAERQKAVERLLLRAPWFWNDPPEENWLTSSVSSFKSLLETHLYCKAFHHFYSRVYVFMFIFLPCLFIKPETLIAKKFLFFNTGVYFEHKHKEV